MADVYDRYGRLAYSVVYRITRHPQTAEDLVQEVFLRLWNRILDFDSERGTLGTWIVCMARSRALDHIKSAELWLVPSTGAPQPAGLFRAQGPNAVYVSHINVDLAHTAAIAVSVEPEGGSPAPTTAPFVAIPLS